MTGPFADKDRLFSNLHGFRERGLEAAKSRGAWNGVAEMAAE